MGDPYDARHVYRAFAERAAVYWYALRRSGVNTDSASGPDRLSPQEIALEASVNNDGDAWSLGYMRRDASHLVTTSRRVGSTTTILT